MNSYEIHTRDLNNSMVFYRTLFDRMPDVFDPFHVVFNEPQFILTIRESQDISAEKDLHFEVQDRDQIKTIYRRMKRYTALNRLKENCEMLDDVVGLTDPDGHRWSIGHRNNHVAYDKCYTDIN